MQKIPKALKCENNFQDRRAGDDFSKVLKKVCINPGLVTENGCPVLKCFLWSHVEVKKIWKRGVSSATLYFHSFLKIGGQLYNII